MIVLIEKYLLISVQGNLPTNNFDTYYENLHLLRNSL